MIDLETSDKQHIVVRSSERAVDVTPGSLIEVLGNVDNRNQIVCDDIITFEPEQTANFGKKILTKELRFNLKMIYNFRYGYVQPSCNAFPTLSSRLSC